MRSRTMVAGLAAGLGLLSLAGCGSAAPAHESSAGAAANSNGAPQSNQDKGAPASAPEGSVAGIAGSRPATSNRVTIGRARILTADLSIRVRSAADVGSVADRAISLVDGVGGESAGDHRVQDGTRTEADLILKVPPAKYNDTLDQLARMGTELQRSAQAEDVTDEVVDVDSRVKSQQASVERIRRLLAGARNLGDVVTIESELAKRQADLESLQARQRALDAQTAAATITLHVRAPGASATAKTESKRGFLAGLDAGWTAFVASLSVALTVLGALLPFGIVVLTVLGVLWLVLRRRRRTDGPGPVVPAPSG